MSHTNLGKRCAYYGYAKGSVFCKRAVDIRAHVGGLNFGWMRRIPCVRTNISQDVVPCDLYTDDDFEWERAVLDCETPEEATSLVEVPLGASPSCPWCRESIAQPDPGDAGWWICPCGKHFGAEDES